MSVTVRTIYGDDLAHQDGEAVAITDQGALFVWPDSEERERHHEQAIAVYAPGSWASATVARAAEHDRKPIA